MINWVKKVANTLPQSPEKEQIPEVSQIDELQTFVGSKKNKIWLWTVVDKSAPGIIGWVLGDRSAETFKPLWLRALRWNCFWYITDGYIVYEKFIDRLEHLVSKISMTRVQGEKQPIETLPRLDFIEKRFVIPASEEMLKLSIRLLLHYLKYRSVPILS